MRNSHSLRCSLPHFIRSDVGPGLKVGMAWNISHVLLVPRTAREPPRLLVLRPAGHSDILPLLSHRHAKTAAPEFFEVEIMKNDIHPQLHLVTATCACGNTFETLSTKDVLRLEICNDCHPFFTGKQKFVDTAGRVERFKRRYGAG